MITATYHIRLRWNIEWEGKMKAKEEKASGNIHVQFQKSETAFRAINGQLISDEEWAYRISKNKNKSP